ncbi:MAG TPA: hypothetical protein PKW30_07250 [Campylobacterales bacterium]|nr:hypothetical protein [Campylobacterales bacterium]
MKNPKVWLTAWGVLFAGGAIGAYLYVKISSTPEFSIISSKKNDSGLIESGTQKSWFERISEKEATDLYPATEIAFNVDMGEPKEEGKEFYYILSISKLSDEKFRIVEKRLNDLRVLHSVKKDGDGYSVNISFKDKLSMQKLASELKNSL